MSTTSEIRLARVTRKAALWFVAFLALLAVGVELVGLDGAWLAMTRLSTTVVVTVLGLSLLNYALRGLRWQFLCRRVGIEVPLGSNLLYYIAGFAFTITPGKIGEVVRLWFLKRGHGYGYDRTAGVMVLDRLSDAWPLLALSLLGVADVAGHGWSLALIAAILIVGTVVMLHPSWLRRGLKLVYARLWRAPRLFARLLRVSRVLGRFGAAGALTPPMLYGTAGWLCEIVGAWLVLDTLGAPLPLTTVAFVFAFGMLVGALPLFPGGIGGAEGTMIALLVLLDTPLATAVAATAIIRAATLGFAVVIGFAILPAAVTFSRRITPTPATVPS